MPQTFSNDSGVYSVDMMFAYVNMFRDQLEIAHLPVNELIDQLEFKGWGDPRNGEAYSPQDVLREPGKYAAEIKRIRQSNLRYPILVYGPKHQIIDGVHRVTKAVLLRKKQIQAYVIPLQIMKKFRICKPGQWKYVDSLQTHDYIELFVQRFIKDLIK